MSEEDYVAEYGEDTSTFVNEVEPVELTAEPTPEEAPEAPEVSAAELTARSQGWVGEDEWEGPEGEWRPAVVFNERGEYFKTMSTQKRDIKKLKAEVNEMGRVMSSIREDERSKVIQELEHEKLDALEEENFAKVVEVDKQLAQAQDELKAAGEVKESYSQDPNADYNAELMKQWNTDNSWYRDNAEMRDYADILAGGMLKRDPNVDPETMLAKVRSETELRFASQFSGTPRQSSDPVMTSSTVTDPTSRRGKAPTASDLNETQLQFGKRFVETGAFATLDAYAAELKAIGDLD